MLFVFFIKAVGKYEYLVHRQWALLHRRYALLLLEVFAILLPFLLRGLLPSHSKKDRFSCPGVAIPYSVEPGSEAADVSYYCCVA